jgi:hypothetical protein
MGIPYVVETPFMSISDKIRKLNAMNVPRAEIAKMLGKRYQHVRNVLEADRLKKKASDSADATVGEPSAPPGASPMSNTFFRLEVAPGGGLALPPDLRRALGVEAGGAIVVRPTSDGWEMIDCRSAARHARDLVRNLNPQGVSLVDELLEERRAEAAREQDR